LFLILKEPGGSVNFQIIKKFFIIYLNYLDYLSKFYHSHSNCKVKTRPERVCILNIYDFMAPRLGIESRSLR